MDFIYMLSGLLSLGTLLFSIYFMFQILKLTKEKRIIASMQIKLLHQYFKTKGVDIDLQKIQEETIKSM